MSAAGVRIPIYPLDNQLVIIKFTGQRVLRKEFSLRRLAIRVQAGDCAQINAAVHLVKFL